MGWKEEQGQEWEEGIGEEGIGGEEGVEGENEGQVTEVTGIKAPPPAALTSASVNGPDNANEPASLSFSSVDDFPPPPLHAADNEDNLLDNLLPPAGEGVPPADEPDDEDDEEVSLADEGVPHSRQIIWRIRYLRLKLVECCEQYFR